MGRVGSAGPLQVPSPDLGAPVRDYPEKVRRDEIGPEGVGAGLQARRRSSVQSLQSNQQVAALGQRAIPRLRATAGRNLL